MSSSEIVCIPVGLATSSLELCLNSALFDHVRAMPDHTFTASNGQKIRCHPGLTQKYKKDCLSLDTSGSICTFDSIEKFDEIKTAFGELVQTKRLDDRRIDPTGVRPRNEVDPGEDPELQDPHP
jgi:hypothetical protein